MNYAMMCVCDALKNAYIEDVHITYSYTVTMFSREININISFFKRGIIMKKCISLLLLFTVFHNVAFAQTIGNQTPVSVEVASKQDMIEILPTLGTVTQKRKVSITSKVSGVQVKQVNVEVGDMVKKEDVLCVLDDTRHVIKRDQKKSDVVQAEIALKQAALNLEVKRREFESAVKTKEKNEELFKVGSLSPDQMEKAKVAFLKKETELLLGEESVKQAKLNVEKAKTALKVAELDLEACTIKTPMSGVVAQRTAEKDETIGSGALFIVLDIATVYVAVEVSEKDIARVTVGINARVSVDAYPNDIFEGVVALISPTADAKSRTFPVRLSVTNKEMTLKPGLFARAELIVQKKKDVLVVPEHAIVMRDGKEIIFVANDGVAIARTIQTGIRSEAKVEIISGIALGDTIIVRGQEEIQDLSPIVIE